MSGESLPPTLPSAPPVCRSAGVPPALRLLIVPILAVLALAGVSPWQPPAAVAQKAPERVLAPELDGAVGYLGSDKPIRLKDLRGKIVLLDFWTLC